MAVPGQIVPFLAVWTKEKQWKTLDTVPTIIISECAGDALLVPATNMTEHPAMQGLYRFLLTLPAGEAKNYIGKCSCSDSDTDYIDTPSFWGDINSVTQVSGIIGNRVLNIQAYIDGTLDPINDALISIADSLGNPLAVGAVTDPAGQTAVILGDGDYQIRARKAGYTFVVVPVTIDGSDVNQIIYGIEYSINPPVDPGLCAIEEYLSLENPDKIPETTSATLRVVALPPGSPTLLTTLKTAPEYDNVTGVIRWEIPRGTTINVNIPEHDIRNYRCIVPDVAGIRLTEIPEI